MIQSREELTARERGQMEHEKHMFQLQAEHIQEVKRLELELARLESKWSAWLKLPLTLIKLPVLVVLGTAYCVAVARKHEPSEAFWRFMK